MLTLESVFQRDCELNPENAPKISCCFGEYGIGPLRVILLGGREQKATNKQTYKTVGELRWMENIIMFLACGHHCFETPKILPALCTEVLFGFLPCIAMDSEGVLGCCEVFMFPAKTGKHLN